VALLCRRGFLDEYLSVPEDGGRQVKTVAIRVGVDVGSKSHQVGIAGSDGQLLEEFQISHSEAGFQEFFDRIEEHRRGNGSSVSVAMEGYNGHSRPLDRHVLEQGYELYSVNNLKLARFREIFPGAAKTDRLDTRKILELFHLKEHLPLAKDVLQRVVQIPVVNARLKRVSRRRRQLVNEKVRVVNRLQSDLQGVCPDLLGLTHDAGNLWFLRFLSCRDDLRQLSRIRMESVLKISGIGKKYAGLIRAWQRTAKFSDEVDYVGSMIISDARRILELIDQISSLESILEELTLGIWFS
jgi:transposase